MLTVDIALVQSFERNLLLSVEEALTYTRHIQIADVKGRIHHHGAMADYAFEAIGSAEAIDQAFRTTRPGGTTVAVGVCPDGESRLERQAQRQTK